MTSQKSKSIKVEIEIPGFRCNGENWGGSGSDPVSFFFNGSQRHRNPSSVQQIPILTSSNPMNRRQIPSPANHDRGRKAVGQRNGVFWMGLEISRELDAVAVCSAFGIKRRLKSIFRFHPECSGTGLSWRRWVALKWSQRRRNGV
ncbi:hypothetical protein ACLOJK_013885 [Asimina triloba]